MLLITLTTFYAMINWVGSNFIGAGEGLKIPPTIFPPLDAASFGLLQSELFPWSITSTESS